MRYPLLFVFLFLSLSAFAEPRNCQRGFWRNGIPREGNIRTPFLCEEFTPTENPLDPRYVNLYYHASRTPDPSLIQYFEKSAESLKRSIKAAKDLFNYSGKVKLILDFSDHPRDALTGLTTYGNAYPFFKNFGESCPILLFPKSERLAPDVLGQIIAHEFFHCVQADKWNLQTKLANESDEGRWHVEGAAQWFSDVMYPNADYEYDSFWGHYDPTASVVAQPLFYTTVIFFQSMWQSANKSAFHFSSFFNDMPITPGADHLAAFASTSNIAKHYHQFVRNFVSRTIRDAGNKNAPVGGIELETVALAGSETEVIQFPLDAFKMQGRRIQFPEKGNYTISFNAPSDVKVSLKLKDDATWTELMPGYPNAFSSKCSSKSEVDFVFTSTKKDFSGKIDFTITKSEIKDCGCEVSTVPVSACLIGNWKMQTAATAPYLRSNLPPGSVLKSTAGTWHLSLGEHKGQMFYDQAQYSVDVATVSPTNPKVPMDVNLNGTWKFNASSESEKVCFKVSETDVAFEAIIHFPGGDVKGDLLKGFVPDAEGAIEFKCLNENQLLYRRHNLLNDSSGRPLFVDWLFTRE